MGRVVKILYHHRTRSKNGQNVPVDEILTHERTALRRRLGATAREAIDERGLTWEHNARRVAALFEALPPTMPG